jgi:hypothetical protein
MRADWYASTGEGDDMTEGQAPEGASMPSAEPPPLAPLVQQPSAPPPPPVAPPVAWAPAPAAVAAPGGRTGLAAGAGVLLLILGILGGLLGLFVAVVGGSFASTFGDLMDVEGLSDPGSLFGGIIAFFGILVVIYSLVYVFAGIGILRSRGWGRVMGLIVGILSGLIWVGGLGQTDQGNMPMTIVMLAIHAYVVVVLLFFWRTRTA